MVRDLVYVYHENDSTYTVKVTLTITSFDKDVQLKFNSASNRQGSCNNKVIESLHHDSRIQNLGILRDNVSGMIISDEKICMFVDGNVNGNHLIDTADTRKTINRLEI